MFFNYRHIGVSAVILCILSVGVSNAWAKSDGRQTVVIPRVSKGPVLNGNLDTKNWQHGVQLSNLENLYEAVKPIQQTTVRAMYDSKNLYLGIKCYEVNTSSLVAITKGYGNISWADDAIDIFIDTANAHHIYYRYSVNPVDGYYFRKSLSGEWFDAKWYSKSTKKTQVGSGAWVVEMAIPFAELGIKPKAGLVFGFNVCRSRKAGDPEYSSWNPAPSGFDQPKNFGDLILGDNSGKWDDVKVLSWGKLSSDITVSSDNILRCSVPNRTGNDASFKVTLKRLLNGRQNASFSKTVAIKHGKTMLVSIPYKVIGVKGESWAIDVETGSTKIFNAVYSAPAFDAEPRVWQLKDPLYKELLSNKPAGLQKDGAIYWGHTYPSSLLSPFAKEYAIRYSKEESVKELADDKLLMIPWPVRPNSILGDPFLMQMSEKYNVKMLLYPDVVTNVVKDFPKVKVASLMLDPGNRATYFNDLRINLQKGQKYIWGIYTGDEFTEGDTAAALSLFWEHKDKYPYINEINEQVKKQYGFGKYGMPESANDDNPYRWIAFHRWINNYWLEWHKEVYETVQKMAPGVKVISTDPCVGPGHRPIGFDRMAQYFDIATQQMYPPKDANRQQFGYTTKMVADITGKPAWTCTHVEYYPYSTTPEETRELMSEVMRNGGKGFHFWLKDEFGNNSPSGFLYSTKWGFPERWRAIMEINRLNATMNEVAIPTDPDFAVFYSEDYYQSFSEILGDGCTEQEWAYTFFGPVARTWFKFVSDNMIEDGKVDLSSYKAVLITAAKYERANVVNSIVKYVSDGGTLVISDPEAFSKDINGDSLESIREKLIGSSAPGKVQKSVTFSKTCSMPKIANRSLTVSSPTFAITPQANAEIMACFADGSPAVMKNKVGKGSVIVFAFNPFTENGIANDSWKSFFKAFSQDLGLKTDRDIWRFKFPPYKTVYQPAPKGVCLTGNYIKWWQDKPVNIQNAEISGAYTYSIQPDGTADRSNKAVSFTTGKLTDRENAYTKLKTQLKPEDFVVTWKTEVPVDVTFDFVKSRLVSRLNLWYSDQLPGLTVMGSADGKKWTKLASYPKKTYVKSANSEENDVLDISLKLSASKNIRFVRLSFDQRDKGNPMTLVECELWGK